MAGFDLFSGSSSGIYCGIDINSSEIVFTLLNDDGGEITDVTGKVKKMSCDDDDIAANLHDFQERLHAFFDDVKPKAIGILKRNRKGKFAASAVSFKLEALIQSYRTVNVGIVSAPTLKAFLKKNELPLAPAHKYQEKALGVAWYLLNKA